MKDVEAGIRLFEVRKGQVLSLELGRLVRLERGYVRITSLSNEVFNLTIAGKKTVEKSLHFFERSRAAETGLTKERLVTLGHP
jgi:hypothetical protein